MNLPKKNWLEWLVFGSSIVLVAGLLGYLGYASLVTGDAPPDLVVELGAPVRQTQHFSVPIAVTNQGDIPAEDVIVQLTLDTGATPEEAQFSVAYLPSDGTGAGWATFQSDPGQGKLTTRVVGYTIP